MLLFLVGESPLVISTLEPDTEQQSTPISEESSPTTSKLTQVSDDKELIYAEHQDNSIVIGELIAGAGDIATQHSAEPNAKQPVSITVPCSVQTNKYLGGKIIVVDKDYFKNRKIESRFRKSNETLSDKAGSDVSLPALSKRVLPEVRAITADNATVDGETEVVNDGTNMGENEGTKIGENDGINMGENASEFNGNGESKEGYEKFDIGRESEHGDPKVVVKSGNKSPVYKQGQKLVTEGTQTPLVARSIYGGMEEEGGVKTAVRSVSVNTDEYLGLTPGQTEKPHTEEYIIVHLPPGTEVTKTEVRKQMDYKQYHEVGTHSVLSFITGIKTKNKIFLRYRGSLRNIFLHLKTRPEFVFVR